MTAPSRAFLLLALMAIASGGETDDGMPVAKSKLAIIVGYQQSTSSSESGGFESEDVLQRNRIVNAVVSSDAQLRAKAIMDSSRNGKEDILARALEIAVQIGHGDIVFSAIVDAADIARSDGEEQIYGKAMTTSILHGGDSAAVWTRAIAYLYAQHGCTKLTAILVEAMSVAGWKWKETAFLDAFDTTPLITNCFLSQCIDGMTKCCSSSEINTNYKCGYSLLKTYPVPMWKCNGACGKPNVCTCM